MEDLSGEGPYRANYSNLGDGVSPAQSIDCIYTELAIRLRPQPVCVVVYVYVWDRGSSNTSVETVLITYLRIYSCTI